MSCNDYIHSTAFQSFYSLLLLSGGAESAQKIHTNGVILHSLYKGIVMLLGKDGGRNQIYNLFTLLHCLKGNPQCYLRLAVAYIAAHKTIHDLRTLHILLGSFNGQDLVSCLFIGEGLLEFFLPYCILRIPVSFPGLSDGIQLHQIICHLPNGLFNLGSGPGPLRASQLVQLRLPGIGSGIFLQGLQLCGQNIEIISLGIFDLDIIFRNTLNRYFLDAPVYSQTVVLMDNVISGADICKADQSGPRKGTFLPFCHLLSENIRLRDNRKIQQRVFKSPLNVAEDHHYLPGLYLPVRILGIKAVKLKIPQVFCQAFCPGDGRAEKDHPAPVFLIPLKILNQQFHTVIIWTDGLAGNIGNIGYVQFLHPGIHGGKRDPAHGINVCRKL